jgi:hypothetical protein
LYDFLINKQEDKQIKMLFGKIEKMKNFHIQMLKDEVNALKTELDEYKRNQAETTAIWIRPELEKIGGMAKVRNFVSFCN